MIKIIFEPAQNRAAAYDGDKNIGEATYLRRSCKECEN